MSVFNIIEAAQGYITTGNTNCTHI